MQSLAVFTDFSPAADNAVAYAARMALKAGTSLTLLHTYQLPVTVNEMPVLLVPMDELQQAAQLRIQDRAADLARRFPKLAVQTVILLGDTVSEVAAWCEEHRPLALVTGSQAASGLERLLMGNEGDGLIRYLLCPVITVPDTYTAHSFTRAVLATDLSGFPTNLAETLLQFCRQLQVSLTVSHITDPGTGQPFTVPALASLDPVYRVVERADVTEGLKELLREPDTDLLILLPHPHSLPERLFFSLHTNKVVHGATKPVLTLQAPTA